VTKLSLLILVIHKHQLWHMVNHLVIMHLGEGRNDDQIAHGCATCCGTVHGNHAGTTLAFDGVGDESLAIVDVPDVDLFILTNVGCIQQVLIDGA